MYTIFQTFGIAISSTLNELNLGFIDKLLIFFFLVIILFGFIIIRKIF